MRRSRSRATSDQHRRRGRPGRDLRAAHQPARQHPHRRRCGVALQGTRRRRAVLPHPEQRAGCAAHPPPSGRRVRAHMFLRMLSYYISWHMKQAPGPDPVRRQRQTRRGAPSAPTPSPRPKRSEAALTKAARKRTEDDYPVHSFTSLLADLATICANHIQPADEMPAFTDNSPRPPRCSGEPSNCSTSLTATVTCRQYTPQPNHKTPGHTPTRQQSRGD